VSIARRKLRGARNRFLAALPGRLREPLQLAVWRREGGGARPPLFHKRAIIAGYVRESRASVFVETGTHYGDTVEAIHGLVPLTFSIELHPELHRAASERFEGYPDVEILQGDSGIVLRDLAGRLPQPAVFWLDGHLTGGVSARGESDTPVLAELRTIREEYEGSFVVLIDDARLFDGTNSYPSLEELRRFVREWDPALQFEVADDIIRIVRP
jgi:hypothetical protein